MTDHCCPSLELLANIETHVTKRLDNFLRQLEHPVVVDEVLAFEPQAAAVLVTVFFVFELPTGLFQEDFAVEVLGLEFHRSISHFTYSCARSTSQKSAMQSDVPSS